MQFFFLSNFLYYFRKFKVGGQNRPTPTKVRLKLQHIQYKYKYNILTILYIYLAFYVKIIFLKMYILELSKACVSLLKIVFFFSQERVIEKDSKEIKQKMSMNNLALMYTYSLHIYTLFTYIYYTYRSSLHYF